MTSGPRKPAKEKSKPVTSTRKNELGGVMDIFAKFLTGSKMPEVTRVREQSGEIGRKNGTPQNRRH